MKKTIKSLIAIGALVAVVWCQNNAIQLEEIPYTHHAIPAAFEGYRIAHVSDLHNKAFGENQKRLLKKLQQTAPDIIVITGDLVDTTETAHALSFAKQAVALAPVYYVSGNHEVRYTMVESLQKSLTACGVTVLDDTVACLKKGAAQISIIGVNDPQYYRKIYDPCPIVTSEKSQSDAIPSLEMPQHGQAYRQMLQYLKNQKNAIAPFSILLAHRPEYLETYTTMGFSLVFTGHAHGGQFRLPFVGGVMSPGQGMFPSYTSGLYHNGSTDMVVSRGLGNSAFPLRIGNRPHLILLTLHSA